MFGRTPHRLSRDFGLASLAFFLLLGVATNAFAQLQNGNLWPNPRLTSLNPTGGKIGTSIEVTFLGTECEAPESLWFNHPGIKGTPIIPPPPPVDPKAKPDPKKKETPPPPITKFTVTIDKSVPQGVYDVRLVNKNGVSNPRVFVVSDATEVAEKEPNNDIEQAQKIELGTIVTGLANATTDVDYFAIATKKGQKVLVHCATASIDSRMTPEIRLLDPSGKQVAYERALPYQDGVLTFTSQSDGEYVLRLNQFTYQFGGNEYFYRLTVSLGPWIHSISPPSIEPGKAAQVTLHGRNLPGSQVDPTAVLDGEPLEKLVVSVTAPGDPASLDKLNFSGPVFSDNGMLDGFEYRFVGPTGVSNPKLITFARAPVVAENDDNDVAEKAQEVPVPSEIAGRINKRRDRDWFSFTAKKGDVFMIDVTSRRYGIASDLCVKIMNPAAKAEITTLDDIADNLNNRFYTNSQDPASFKFTAPADGKYQILVGSHLADNSGDPTHVYRLRILPENPDFRLFVMPSDDHRPDSFQIGAGGAEHFTVFAMRTDGFKEDITLTVEGLPAGLTAAPQVLNRNMKYAHLVVTGADNAAPFTGPIRVIGTATQKGQKVVHEARPATISFAVPVQQNIPTLTRLHRSLVIAVRGKAPGKLTPVPDKAVVTHGEKAKIALKLARTDKEFKSNFQVTPVPADMPPGVTFGAVTFAPGKDEMQAEITVPATVAPGHYNLVFRGFAPISPADKAKPVNTILPSSPFLLTVIPKQVATLSVDNANPQIKIGADGAITVKVARQFDYADAFKIEAELPKDVKGVDIPAITIPPGMNEAKLTIRVAKDFAPRQLQNLTLKAVAVVNGNVNLNHELKFNVNVVK